MNQAQSNSFNVNSQFFIQQLDSLIIQIVRAIAVEHSIAPDPDAKEMVRKILLNRAHELMSDQSKEFADTYKDHIVLKIEEDGKPGDYIPNSSYEFIKLMGLG